MIIGFMFEYRSGRAVDLVLVLHVAAFELNLVFEPTVVNVALNLKFIDLRGVNSGVSERGGLCRFLADVAFAASSPMSEVTMVSWWVSLCSSSWSIVSVSNLITLPEALTLHLYSMFPTMNSNSYSMTPSSWSISDFVKTAF